MLQMLYSNFLVIILHMSNPNKSDIIKRGRQTFASIITFNIPQVQDPLFSNMNCEPSISVNPILWTQYLQKKFSDINRNYFKVSVHSIAASVGFCGIWITKVGKVNILSLVMCHGSIHHPYIQEDCISQDNIAKGRNRHWIVFWISKKLINCHFSLSTS